MAQEKRKEAEALADFDFDTQEDFDFGLTDKPDTSTKASTVVGKVKKDDFDDDDDVVIDDDDDEEDVTKAKVKGKKPKEKIKTDEDEDEVEDVDFDFGEDEDDDGKDDGKDTKAVVVDKNEPVDESKFYTTLASELKEKGVLKNVTLEDGKDYTEDEFFDLQEKEIDSRVDEVFEGFFEEFDEDGKEFLKFKRNGGKTADFLNVYGKVLDVDELSADKPSDVRKLLSYYISSVEEADEQEVDDKIKWLTDSGKEVAYFEKYKGILKDNKLKAAKALDEYQKAKKKETEDNAKEFASSLQELAGKTEKIGAFTFSKVEQKEIPNFITKPTVKVGNNKFVSALSFKLNSILNPKTDKDKENLLLLGKLLNSDFNVENLVTTIKTEVAKKTRSKLIDAKNNVSSKTTYGRGKSLADYIT